MRSGGAYRISHIAYRISHIAYRISHIVSLFLSLALPIFFNNNNKSISHSAYLISHITYHRSHITYHISYIAYQISLITSHTSQMVHAARPKRAVKARMPLVLHAARPKRAVKARMPLVLHAARPKRAVKARMPLVFTFLVSYYFIHLIFLNVPSSVAILPIQINLVKVFAKGY